MAVNISGAPVGAEESTPDPAPPGPAGRTRRDLARGLRACALTAALIPAIAAFRAPRPRSGPGAPGGTAFAQTHRGRRIRGVWMPASGDGEDGRWHVTVDGRPLHLMRRADGTWLSMVDHYCSYPTPLDAARAAVDALVPGRRLRADGAAHAHREDRHGVRA
ncbi:tyrosinase family oxidase copper chaperone [Streptomyces griseoloalbus]|uniref:Tyrosinase co-factor n=1 Tax=Streptomyces griseoloalbus TaxID=67303 RepID=A0A7W8BLC2_9ACTN|nr:tyrosinase family oxidase copper chaperone [Streptomyces albaduncus]MBB5123584.1 hypothetical protein [Streptomyces albaduncus]GGW79268.1 tyrosinase [Streptomyces albaduncus]